MTKQELAKVRENARQATTEDLLDRVTVYRGGMEPDAIEVIEADLNGRGVCPGQILAHSESNENVLLDENGVALMCSICEQPAIAFEKQFFQPVADFVHGLMGGPFFGTRPRTFCKDHLPGPPVEPQI